VASAGYGKSEAVRDAVPDGFYVHLARRHDTVETVAKDVVAAAAPKYLRALAHVLQRPSDSDARSHLAGWVGARLRMVTKPIVLEDFHRVNGDASIVTFVRRLIEATAPQVRWVITSREQPDLPVTRWITRGWMTLPLSEYELQFTDEEAVALAGAAGVAIDAEDIRALRSETSGWPIALRLALSGWDRTRGLPLLRLRTRDMLYDYIEGEIWANVSAAERRLLEAMSLLAAPSVAVLAEAGISSPTRTLGRLHRRIPLVQRTGTNDYRLHDLLRDYVIVSLRSDEARLTETAEAVAAALEQRGQHVEALRLYVEVGAKDRIVKILESFGYESIELGERAAVTAAIEALGRDGASLPIVQALRGYLFALDGNFNAAETNMRRALEKGLTDSARLGTARHLANILTNHHRSDEAVAILRPLLGNLQHSSTELEMLSWATLASALAMTDQYSETQQLLDKLQGLEISEPYKRALSKQHLALAAFYLDDYDRAELLANDAAQDAAANGLDRIAATAHSVLISVFHVTQSSVHAAINAANEMLVSAIRCGDKQYQGHALKSLFIAATNCGLGDLVLRAEGELARLGHIQSFRDSLPYAVALAINKVGNGNINEAISAMSSVSPRGLTEHEESLRSALLTLLYAVIGKAGRTSKLMAPKGAAVAKGDYYSRRYRAHAAAYRALADWIDGRPAVARRALAIDRTGLSYQDAAIIATIASVCAIPCEQEDGANSQLRFLLRPLLELELHGYVKFIEQLVQSALAKFGQDGTLKKGERAFAKLTKAESEILQMLPLTATYKEIAAIRGVSENTIKVQVQSILAKLNVDSRYQAVAIGKKRGYLQED
jgi:ATP/maltotriose-dependent transcriptional regulator MalT